MVFVPKFYDYLQRQITRSMNFMGFAKLTPPSAFRHQKKKKIFTFYHLYKMWCTIGIGNNSYSLYLPKLEDCQICRSYKVHFICFPFCNQAINIFTVISTFFHLYHLSCNRYVPLDSCLVPLPGDSYKLPSSWPERLTDKPPSLIELDAIETYKVDTRHWSALVSDVYFGGININWSSVRNIMDMNAHYGG